MPKLSVLLTGANGYIARQLLSAFRDRYDLTLIDLDSGPDSARVQGVVTADLLRDDPDTLAPLFSGVDVVVHTGYHRPTDTDPQALYNGERRNVDMTQRVYRLALEQGVRRVVVASTNQAAKWYE